VVVHVAAGEMYLAPTGTNVLCEAGCSRIRGHHQKPVWHDDGLSVVLQGHAAACPQGEAEWGNVGAAYMPPAIHRGHARG